MMTEEEQMRMELQRMQRRADEITDEVRMSIDILTNRCILMSDKNTLFFLF